MSSQSDATNAAIVQQISEQTISLYCQIASSAIIAYEHIVTLDLEIAVIWQYPISGVTALLLLNRFTLLSAMLLNILNEFNCCEALDVTQGATIILSYAIAAVFSALRVYAITGRRWHWTLLTLFTGLVPVGANIYGYTAMSKNSVALIAGIPECTYTSSTSPNVHRKLLIATRTCAMISDVCVIIATWINTFSWARNAHSRRSIHLVILRDGTIYFLALLILNIVQIATTLNDGTGSTFSDDVESFLPAISGVLISRFMFNLRQCTNPQGAGTGRGSLSLAITQGGGCDSSRSHASIDFTPRLIGNMGESLDHGILDSSESFSSGDIHEIIRCNEELLDDAYELSRFQRIKK